MSKNSLDQQCKCKLCLLGMLQLKKTKLFSSNQALLQCHNAMPSTSAMFQSLARNKVNISTWLLVYTCKAKLNVQQSFIYRKNTLQIKPSTVRMLRQQTLPAQHCFITSQQTKSYKKNACLTMQIPNHFLSKLFLITENKFIQTDVSTAFRLQSKSHQLRIVALLFRKNKPNFSKNLLDQQCKLHLVSQRCFGYQKQKTILFQHISALIHCCKPNPTSQHRFSAPQQ